MLLTLITPLIMKRLLRSIHYWPTIDHVQRAFEIYVDLLLLTRHRGKNGIINAYFDQKRR
jgi:hypothetical protein